MEDTQHRDKVPMTPDEMRNAACAINSAKELLIKVHNRLRVVKGGRVCLDNLAMALPFVENAAKTLRNVEVAFQVESDTSAPSDLDERKCSFMLAISDRVVIADRWEGVITAITLRASGQVEYQIEWVGDGEFKSEWLTVSRIRELRLKVYRNGREVVL